MKIIDINKILILIPSLDPDEKLALVVNSLQDIGFKHILLVDDGSADENKHYFDKLKQENNCILITHEVNKGKGRALKTGFSYALEHSDNFQAVITVDGDNQHKADDVFKIAQNTDKNCVTLGVRSFSKENSDIPLRSRAGNLASAFAFRLISGNDIEDTQTGLRGFHIDNLRDIVSIDGERFEFEMNVLLHLKKLNLSPVQIPIQTIYINENETSHFNPILDSFKVFGTILSFLGSSVICFIIDIFIYSFFIYFIFHGEGSSSQIFVATLISRVVSSIVNFTLNYKVVFKSNENIKSSVIKYYSLAIVQMFLSSTGTIILDEFILSPIISKVIVDFTLFILSYLVQKKMIFRR